MFFKARINVRSLWVLLTSIIWILCSCDTTPNQVDIPPKEAQKMELLIYCGITMTQPVMELAAIVEQEKNCTIKISYGESEWLKNTAINSKTGDVLFPGSPSYLESMIKDGTVKETVTVGENRIVLMVRKGNPKQIQPDLKELLREDLQIVLGAPNSGSIGKETRYHLDKLGIYDQAINKALYLTADSKGLIQALRSQDADAVVNWRALIVLHENNQFMENIALPEAQSESRPLVMGLLSFSKHEDLAKYFMARASSETGHQIFSKYGF